ncbi:hypothetical protein SERLA73DRAFT_150234 [Serpula lacrymans var. lacrymans S7.3]|uniref:DUF6532 domain-containing protein n=1 Tax=Serpula lacrymans var. lacrymans (strain S7.3) TaxID=936435 RepID=F8PLN1_SERL3|nr:hypothetical protein SERLA73DRAFT_150234 [Serpula lacrymans var. lacrymans S7.3]
MVFVCTSLPDYIHSSLQPKLLVVFENNELLTEKPVQHDEDDMFEALYFSWYNHHCTRGDDTPAEILPLMLEREDRRCTNYSQMIPYLSKEIKDDSTIYQTIKVVFADLFHWIHDVIELQLPEEYELLAEVTSILPGINLSPIFPFLSLVINLNVSTKGHRDSKDKDFCLVLPIGNFQGGALVMVETVQSAIASKTKSPKEILKCTADTLEEEDEGEDAPLPPSQKHRHRREVVDDQDEENDTNMVQTPPSTQPRSCGPIDNKDEDGGGDDDTNTEEFRNTVRGDSEQEEKDDGNHSQMQGRKDAQQADNIGESTSTPSCLPSAALSIQPSSCTSSTAMASVSPSSAMTRKHKPTLALFPPSFAQLAIEAHTQMRLHISTNEGFPASNIHSDISWQIITESSKIGNSFESKLREIEENEALKIFMMDYVVAKARLMINGAYGIPGDMSPEEIKLAVQWLIDICTFINGDLDIKGRTYNKQKPFSNSIFKDLIRNQWFGRKGEGIRLSVLLEPMMVMVKAYKIFQRICSKLVLSNLISRWGFYFEKLSTLQKCCPGWMTQMRNNPYESIL